MPIDDPISAVETIVANEERAASPVQRYLDAVLNSLPIKASAIARRANAVVADRLDKQALLVDVLVSETRYHARRIEELYATSEAHRRFIADEFRPLVVDGLKKAEETRAQDRIRRIGTILANALTISPPPAADDVEELARIAMNLSHRDVLMLGIIYEAQLGYFDDAQGFTAAVVNRGDRTEFRQEAWPIENLRQLGFDKAERMAIPAKLASFGLIQAFEWLDGPPYPQYMLRNGKRFVEFATPHTDREGGAHTMADTPAPDAGEPINSSSD